MLRRSFATILVSAALFVAACTSRAVIHPHALELNRLGAQALSQGDLEVAAARLSLAVEYAPEFTEAWINLGLLELAREDLELAERRFKRAIAIDPDAAGAYVGLGVIAEKQGDRASAERSYRKALSIDPGLPEPRADLARLLVARGALDEARDQLRRLVEVQADDPAGWMGLAEVLWRMDRDPEASAIVDEAILKLGDRPETELLLARRDLRAGALHEAITRLEVVAKSPGGIGRLAGGWLAVAKFAVGDRAGAKAAARAVLDRDPEDALARHVMKALEAS